MLRSVFPLSLPAALAVLLILSGCAGPAPYRYHYIPGKTAVLQNGYAIAPANAPAAVQRAVAAGNRIAGLPYRYGAGHSGGPSDAYDCSGAASYLLKAAGSLGQPIPSRAFRKYGQSGKGKWISIYARKDHVFLVVAGLRFDTGWGRGASGPQWSTMSRPTNGTKVRHPVGL